MTEIKCEICGGNTFRFAYNLFGCENCGIKYPTTWLKKQLDLLEPSFNRFAEKDREEDREKKQQEEAKRNYEKACEAYKQKKYKEAAESFLVAAEKGHQDASYRLGKMYYAGEGIPRDFKNARKWYEETVKQGVNDSYYGACYGLGMIRENKEGACLNYVEALRYYRAAAERCDAACSKIGDMYFNGIGVRKNDLRALAWYKKAFEGGRKSAKERFQKVYDELLTWRLGECVCQGVSKKALVKLDKLTDYAEIRKWFNTHKPDYKSIVRKERIRLDNDIEWMMSQL